MCGTATNWSLARGRAPAWTKWRKPSLRLRWIASHGAFVNTSEGLGKAEAGALYHAMEDSFLQFLKKWPDRQISIK